MLLIFAKCGSVPLSAFCSFSLATRAEPSCHFLVFLPCFLTALSACPTPPVQDSFSDGAVLAAVLLSRSPRFLLFLLPGFVVINGLQSGAADPFLRFASAWKFPWSRLDVSCGGATVRLLVCLCALFCVLDECSHVLSQLTSEYVQMYTRQDGSVIEV